MNVLRPRPGVDDRGIVVLSWSAPFCCRESARSGGLLDNRLTMLTPSNDTRQSPSTRTSLEPGRGLGRAKLPPLAARRCQAEIPLASAGAITNTLNRTDLHR